MNQESFETEIPDNEETNLKQVNAHEVSLEPEDEKLKKLGNPEMHSRIQKIIEKAKEDQNHPVYLWATWVAKKIEEILWVFLGAIVLFYSNFFHNMYSHPKVNQLFLYIGCTCACVNIWIMFFAGFVLPMFKINSIDEYNPKVVYVGAFCGFISFLGFSVAMWPVYGWLTIPIMFIMFVGYINVGHFVPANMCGSLMFFSLSFAIIFSSYWIEHEGYFHRERGD